MNRKLLTKLVLLYIASAVVMFVLLNSYGVRELEKSLIEKRKETLYEEALVVHDEYVVPYYANQITVSELIKELTLLDSFMEARIWIVNMDGKVIGDTRRILGSNINVFQCREDFLEHTFLEDVHFKGVFTEPMLSVTVPITYQCKRVFVSARFHAGY